MKTVIKSVEQAMAVARSQAKKGNVAKAVQIYQSVLVRFPQNKRAQKALQDLQSGAGGANQQAKQPNRSEIERFNALFNAGNGEAAAEFASVLQKKYPNAAVTHNMAGTSLVLLGRYEDAIQTLEKAVRMQPNNHQMLCNLAAAHFKAEDFRKAYVEYTKALKLKPDHFDGYLNRAQVCYEARKYEDAISDAKKALAMYPKSDTAQIILGRAYYGNFHLKEALASFESVLERNPNNTRMQSMRASALVALGRIDEAVVVYEDLLKRQPSNALVFTSLCKLKKFAPDDPLLDQMSTLSEDPDLDAKVKIMVLFGLANAYQKMGDPKKSFEFLAAGNKLKDSENKYTIEKDRALFSSIKSYFKNTPPDPLPAANLAANPVPIFIVGMPRSGTTLCEQILSSHTEVHGAGELRELGRAVSPWFNDTREHPTGVEAQTMLKHIRRTYLGSIPVQQVNTKFFTDKLPMNFRWIGFILNAFPEAKIIHMNRDPMAVCWSNYRQLFAAKGLQYAYDQKNLGLYFNLYRDLMAFWRDQYPDRFYDLNYEELTQNQESETRKLLAYCGLEWQDACLDFHKNTRSISTASVTQVRKKMYQGSSKAWEEYHDELETLRDTLASAPEN